jgi:TPR repeat protein
LGYGRCLLNGCGVPIDLPNAVHYFKLSADHSNANSLYEYAVCFLHCLGVPRHIAVPIRWFSAAASAGNANSQAAMAWMSANGVAVAFDLNKSAVLYECSSDLCPSSAAAYGSSSLTGRGIPVDFTLAVAFFQRAADSGDSDGANCLGGCLERGDGINADLARAALYFRMAAARFHPDGLYNFGLCLEYGKGVPRDRERAVKYYRLAAKLGHSAAENRFGICVECGISFQSNVALAAHYYRLSAMHGDPDGANNLGFCLEHGRGVRRDIRLGADCYKFAADHGHVEAVLNYQRCLRLLGRWEVPDRSFDLSLSAPAREDLAEQFIVSLDDSGQFGSESDGLELRASIERFKRSQTAGFLAAKKCALAPVIGRSGSSVLTLAECADGVLAVVKTATKQSGAQRISREAAIHKTVNHPLVIRVRGFYPQTPEIVTEFVERGQLAAHRPLSDWTLIAKIVAGIVIAMRHLHSCGVVHRVLAPDKILLD